MEINTNIKSGVHIIIDYLSVSFPFRNFNEELEKTVVEQTVWMIGSFMGFAKEEIVEEEYSTSRYKYQYQIGDNIILRLVGPDLKNGMPSCHLELRGQGCREFENQGDKTFYDLIHFLVIRLNGNVTRIDIAIDDYDGVHCDIVKIKTALDERNYTTSFRMKTYELHGSNEKGWSLQFGSHQSSQMLVIYDKLKEQLSKNIDCEQKFWTRYELRYKKDKAYNVCLNLLDHKDDFQNYVYGLLYEMLDFKVPNNYDDNNKYKADTLDWWKAFLNEVDKSEIIKYKIKSVTLERYLNWIMPILGLYFVFRYQYNNHNMQKFLLSLLDDSKESLKNIDSRKIKKINDYLKGCKQKPINKKDINKIINEIEFYIDQESLPF